MKRPYLSIIIPAYKDAGILSRLLDSIFATHDFKDFEVLVIDDCSPDDTKRVVELYKQGLPAGGRGLKYFRLRKNSGPAKARNEGVKRAKGKIILFLDADVQCFPDTIVRVAKRFQRDSDLTALTGVWGRSRRTKKFFANFKALRDWSFWINERSKKSFYYLFSTRIAAIRKEVFLRLGGFNEKFRGADIEDIEFTYRIASRYAVIFDEKIRVKHEFEDFWPVAKKYFRRSFFWSQLFASRLKFDAVAMTPRETLSGLSAVLCLPVLIISIFFPQMLLAILFLLFLIAFGNRKFLVYVYQQEGMGFVIKSFWTNFILYYVIYAGAALAGIALMVKKIFGPRVANYFNLAVSELIR